MQLRTLVIGGVAVIALVAVRRHAQSEAPTYKRAPAVAKRDARVPVEKLRRAAALPVLEAAELDEDFEAYEEAADPDADPNEVIEVRSMEPTFPYGHDGQLGVIEGVTTDRQTGEKLVGVTVVATSTALQGSQTAITDETGSYRITNLPEGSYVVTFYYADYVQEHLDRTVTSSRSTAVYAALDVTPPVIEAHQGITIDVEYRKDIIVGRTFESVLSDATADGQGVSFSGVTTLDNVYIVEEPAAEPANEFIEEIEVIGRASVGGY